MMLNIPTTKRRQMHKVKVTLITDGSFPIVHIYSNITTKYSRTISYKKIKIYNKYSP